MRKILINTFLILVLLTGQSCKNKSQKTTSLPKESKTELLVLEEETIYLELMYYDMGCSCPQWATEENIKRFQEALETDNPIPMDSLFIEIVPSSDTLPNPFDLDYSSEPKFKFTGRYYKGKQKWNTESGGEYIYRVFQFQKISVAK